MWTWRCRMLIIAVITKLSKWNGMTTPTTIAMVMTMKMKMGWNGEVLVAILGPRSIVLGTWCHEGARQKERRLAREPCKRNKNLHNLNGVIKTLPKTHKVETFFFLYRLIIKFLKYFITKFRYYEVWKCLLIIQLEKKPNSTNIDNFIAAFVCCHSLPSFTYKDSMKYFFIYKCKLCIY